MLELLLTHNLSRIVLVLLFLETLKEFDKLRIFLWENMQKVFRISCEYKICENYSILTPFKGLSRLGTRLVVVLLCGMRPHAIRDLETMLRVMLTPDRDSTISCNPMPFCRVEHGSLLGRSVSVMGWAVRSHAVFMRSFSQDCHHAGYAAIGSVNRSVPWLAPI